MTLLGTRYEYADSGIERLLRQLVKRHFEEAERARFLLLMDSKRVMKDGKLVFARIKKANDEVRTLTATDNEPEGVDYVIYMDDMLFSSISTKDKRRVLFHELKHMEVDEEVPTTNRKKKFNTTGHEFEGFHDEISFNKDDPQWQGRLGNKLAELYGLKEPEEDNDE